MDFNKPHIHYSESELSHAVTILFNNYLIKNVTITYQRKLKCWDIEFYTYCDTPLLIKYRFYNKDNVIYFKKLILERLEYAKNKNNRR